MNAEVSTRTLVESMIREDETVDGGELYTVGGLLGMTDQQVRLCIKRLVVEGRFTQEGRGRRAVLLATPATHRELAPQTEFLRLMYAQDRGRAPWDGVWHLAGFAVPESVRPARDALRETLVRLGGAQLQGGLYVSANAWEDLVEPEAARLGVSAHLSLLTSTDLHIGGVGEPRALAGRLWPLEALAVGHRRLADLARERLDRLAGTLPPAQVLTIAIELAAEFSRAMEPDPLLPAELLPQPWPGAEARALVAQCWARLLEHPSPEPAPRLFRLYQDVVADITLR